MLSLSPAEARVAGCLIEKEITTPEYYPLSLNALLNACNQKSSREPVMTLSEADVRTALFELENVGLVRVLADARVSKFEHLLYNKLNLRRPEIAVMCLLLLRGPQTAAELRSRAERLYSYDDTGAVTDTLERLASREEPLVRMLPRQPGARESRWAHLLSGEVSDAGAGEAAGSAQSVEPAGGAGRLLALEQAVEELRQRVETLEARAGGAAPAED